MRTRKGKNIAVNPDSVVDPGATEFDRKEGHVCHWDTCDARKKDTESKPEPDGFPDECPF
ncbi:hypothetical protein L0152_07380 [bacterium]|nr:hypothetical protein [bacterium]